MKKQIDLKELLRQKTEGIMPVDGAQERIEAAERQIPKNLMYDAESSEFKPETKPVRNSAVRRLTVEEAKECDDEMSKFINEVLVPGVDFGVVPRTSKPTLLKPGAEKILNYLGLIPRVEVVNRIENISEGYFAYEVKVYVIDSDGVVRGEGVGITNSKEGKYAKSTGFAVQNTILKMAKKRALVDATLNVGAISGRFTQDVEDVQIEPDAPLDKTTNEVKANANAPRPATVKQLSYLKTLMDRHGTTEQALNTYVRNTWGIDDYRKVSSTQASELIERFKSSVS